MITYPGGQITPNQFRRVIEGAEPFIAYRGWDGAATFHLMGPLSPVPGVQDGVTITRDSIRGFMAPWQTLDQAGANQDGVTFNDAVFGPAEIDFVVEAHGNTVQSTRRVIRDWVSSWNPRATGELSVFTKENGMWWADVRWLRAPTDALMRAKSRRQRFVWTARIDDAFWKSWDSVGYFGFSYESMTDTFEIPYTNGLGPNWPLAYYGSGGGNIYGTGSQAAWNDQTGLGTSSREVVCGPYKNFNTSTNNCVVSMVLGTIPEISLPTGAFNDLWGRMGRNSNGTWNGFGVRCRVGPTHVSIDRFNGFTGGLPRMTIMGSQPLILPPVFGDKFTFVCGVENDERLYRVQRNGVTIMERKEDISAVSMLPDNPSAPLYSSAIGSSYRGIGFGMYAAGALITQATPANVRKISAGDNETVSQGAYVPLTNIGDVETWPRYLLYGPGTFLIGNGPYSTDFVEFGPLRAGQVVLLETEPRRRSVVDVSPSALPAQVLNPVQALIKALVTFATNNNVPPLLQEFESAFGILPPQAPLYSLLNGRFTAAVPPKPAGSYGVMTPINIRIDNGNSQSKVVAAITPRRKWPL